MEIKLNPKLVNKRFRQLLQTTQRYVIVFGGSSSSKSYSIFSMVPTWLMQGRSILGIRHESVNVRRSVFLEVTKAISRQKLHKYFTINKTEMTIICKISNGSMVHRGVKDIETLKSVTPLKADTFDLVIVEEATELKDEEMLQQILLRQRGITKFQKQIYLLFNPINITHYLYERFFKPIEDEYDFNNGRDCLEYHGEKVLIHKSTYEDNVYLGQEERDEFNLMKERSPSMYRVYAQGNFGVFGELVYEDNVQYVAELPIHIRNLPWRLGLDHGYQDFQSFCISKYDAKSHTIYIVDMVQKRKSLPRQYSVEIKTLMQKHNIPLTQPIYADSSDPTKNELFREYGLNVRSAIKGGGSKMTGIMWLKGNVIVVPYTLTEFKDSLNVYIWKKKNGVLLDDTEHLGSDILDALRYSFELDSKGNMSIYGKHITL